MDKKTKWLFFIFFAIIIAVVVITFNKYFLAKDYYIQTEIDCDPTIEKCFIYECDPESEECSDDPEENISYYKLIRKKAFLFPDCDPSDENCPQVSCLGDDDCEVTLCDEADEEASCNDPEEYNLNNPVEEEGTEEDAEEVDAENAESESESKETSKEAQNEIESIANEEIEVPESVK